MFTSAAGTTAGFGTSTQLPGFSSSTQAPTSGSSTQVPTFGSTSTASNTLGFSFNPQTSSAFQTSQPVAQNGFKPSLFSTQPGTSLFSNQQGTSLFPTQQGISMFSTQPTSSFQFGSAQPQNPDEKIWVQLTQVHQDESRAKNPMQPSAGPFKPDNVWQALALLKSWWDPTSPNCQFKYYFYNKVDPKEVQLYQRPANHDVKAWDDAQKSNPDPTCMAPALAIGFGDIKKRIDVQDKTTAAHKYKLSEIEQKIKQLQNTDLAKTAAKLEEYRTTQRELAQRVVKFLKHVQVLRCKGLSVTAEEEAMRAQFENIQDQLQRSEQFHGKLSQMWAQLQLIKESGRRNGSEDRTMWNTLSQQNILDINKTMDEQQNGIQHLFDTLQKDEKEIEKLREDIRQ